MRLLTMKNVNLLIVCCLLPCTETFCESYEGYSPASSHMSEADDSSDDDRLWDSKPEEIDSVNIQVLDKISGKVFREKIKVDQEVRFESLKIRLKRCFKNSPDDSNEIYAYIIIQDGERVRFSGWLYASAPAVNLFEHSVYDVRVEF